MTVPRIFATHAAGNVPASYLDEDFAAVLALALQPGVTGTDFSAWSNYLLELNPGDLADILYTANGGGQLTGIYSGNVSSFLGISTVVTAADDPPSFDGSITPFVPRNALNTLITNNGSIKDACGFQPIVNCAVSDTIGFGINPVAVSNVADSTVKLVGMEIDVILPAATTNNAGGGLFMNIFNAANGGPAIQLGGISGGFWSNGIMVSGIKADGTAFGVLGGSSSMDSGLNLSLGIFSTAAIELGNLHNILFQKAMGGAAANIYADASDHLNIATDTHLLVLRTQQVYGISNAALVAELTSTHVSHFASIRLTSDAPKSVDVGLDSNGAIALTALTNIAAGTIAFAIFNDGAGTPDTLLSILGNGTMTALGAIVSGSTLSTTAPAGSSAGLWKLGAIKAGAVTLDTSRSIQVDIGGTVYNVMVST